jgi:hypothetical protein
MAELRARIGGQWVTVGAPAPVIPDEVWIGPDDPRIADPTGTWEIWIYTPPPPYLGSVDVASLVSGAMTQVTVMGQDFVAGESVVTFMGVVQPEFGAGSATKMYAEITVPAGTTGDQPITVRNPDGQESAPYLISVVQPAPPPVITSPAAVNLFVGIGGVGAQLPFTGTGFQDGCVGVIGAGDPDEPLLFTSSTSVIWVYPLQSAPRTTTFAIRNPDGGLSATIPYTVT